MTPLNRPVVRVTSEYDYVTKRPFVIRLESGGRLVRIKTKGSRTWFTIPVKQLWRVGAENQVAENRRLRAEKRAARRARRLSS